MNCLCLPPAQLRDTMSRLPYFKGWDGPLISRLAAHAMQFTVPKDTLLLAKEAKPEYLHVIVSGQVRLFIPLANGAERIIALMTQGEGFGEAALLTNAASPYSVAACSNSHVLAINAHAYLRELNASPAMMECTLKTVAGRLMHTLMDMDICSQPSSLYRVIRYLAKFQPVGCMGGFDISLPGRKRDIAAKLGLTQETLSRMLGFLGQQGAIRVSGAVIRVENPERLKDMEVTICDKAIHKG